MGFIKPNNNSGGSGGGLTPQELSRLNNAYTHSKSEHAPTTAEQNVQPDWNETDETSDAYIKNKPDLSQVGSGEVDLSGYVTKETGNASQITFADGQTFQAKLNNGTLKGEKGDKGERGADGLTTAISVNGNTYTHSNGTITLPNYPSVVSTANGISIADTANNFTATNVEGALAELFQYASNGKTLIAQAITGKGIDATSNDTWQELATKISQILGSTVKINSLSKLSDCKFKLISSKSNTSYNSTAETGKNYNDDSWDSISIPHDWSIYNSFNSNSPSGYEGGYLDGGDAWYRFKLKTAKLEGQKVYIYFDGIYMESDIYINGTKVKSNKWYNPFYVEITDYLQYDNNDTLAVFVRNQQPSSRWYSGSGIIRNAYLVSANDVEIGINDINITTPTLETDVKTNVANTKIDVKINSTTAKTVNLVNEIYFNNSLVKSNTTEVTLSVGSNSVTDTIQINNPTLWDEYEGNLYTLKTYIKEGGATCYSSETKYGYRYFKFDKDTGFWLNGRNLKLRGVCMHHDLGCLGAEVNKSAIERQVSLLIDMGVNAIRITHNPGSSEFLNVCAEKGILVIEELFDCWTSAKKQYDFARYYNDYAKEVIDNTINRDKNNPSIIMWSIGNEIIRTSGSYDSATATGFVQNMINWIKAIDNERMVTMGDDTPTNSISQDCMRLLDVVGVNYGSAGEYSSLRTAIPNKPIYGSETTSSLSSRGVYSRDDAKKQCSSFDNDKVGWGEYASIELKKHMNDIDYLAGMFVWTGFDYIGEPTPFNTYPCKSSYFGIYDTCGFPKDIMYMYQSRWTSNPMIHILPHWDWKSSNIKVWLYSNCYKVELFLNGTSLGEKLQTNIGGKYQFEYSVPYAKGTLVANGYNQNGDIVAQDIIYTSQGTALTTKLSTDKTSVNINSDDLVFITCDIIDKNGVIIPTANNKITFTVEGGTIVGTDNGDATCVEKYRTNAKTAFNGKVLCVVKHDGLSGNMVIKANGDNLTEQSITVIKGVQTVLTQKAKQPFIDATNPTIYEYPVNVTKYSITNNLTNCTTSNSSTIIDENSDYTATITANSGYGLQSVTVTMGGIDITSTAYSNGTITINSVTGNIVITANANIQSTEPNILYSLPEETVFDGTSTYIDTGVALLSTDQDFTIALDVTATEPQNNKEATLLHCMHEARPYPGISIMSDDVNRGFYITKGNNSSQIGSYPYLIPLNTRTKVIITKEGTTLSAYSSNGITGTSNYTYSQVSENLLIGAYQTVDGTKGRYFKGTVHDFKIYNKVFTSEEKDAYLNINGGDTDTTLLYSLPEETVFNGTNTYIDTGVALLSTDQDFTIVLDATVTNPQVEEQATLFHCMHEENPYPGLSFMTSRGDNGFYIPKGSNAGAIGKIPYLIPLNERAKVVIIKEGTRLSAYNSNNVTAYCNYTYTQVSENLLIGAYQTVDGTKGRYFKGTVHDFKIYNKAFTSQEINGYLNINGGGSRVFKIDSTSMNTAENTLTDNIAGISATLTGNPTVSGNQIAFTADDKFRFDLSSLNLTSSNRTLRIKFTPTSLNNNLRNVMIFGSSANAWNTATSCYMSSVNFVLQHGSNNFTNVTTGSENGGLNSNRLSTTPVAGQEYEVVISEHTNGNIRWFINGTLVQDGTTTLFNPLYLTNIEGTARFVGSYSLIEIYNGYCNDYTEFTNMVNNA